ncbi:5'-nucleotidase domain-containing protein 3 isoform X2 [Narcine bancroftii]|uniref:5'-nucleotidase domain-containing protein 3 isoform X2 n=1 Tax=Narcine bancroftii TaxID=1343680 RepID=UPI003831B4AA
MTGPAARRGWQRVALSGAAALAPPLAGWRWAASRLVGTRWACGSQWLRHSPGRRGGALPAQARAPYMDSAANPRAHLWELYHGTKKDLSFPGKSISLNPDGIFANNEVCLSDIEIYGFDYDYTLAFYSCNLHTLIFNAAREILIEQHKYPEDLRSYDYNPNFVIRGLHYDVQKGIVMKIDAFHYMQLGTVYRGLSPVPDEQVIEIYEGTHVPLEHMSDFYGKEVIRDVHVKGILYQAVEQDIEQYISHEEKTGSVLERLINNGKKLFLITNSPISFVDKGMQYIVGKDWRDLFDIIIVQAEKPAFFNDKRRPFRRANQKGKLHWDKISKLEKGQIYKQGNLYEFLKLTGWIGSKVLYFGDHIYSDLADLTLKHGWRTGAIVPELRSEIKTMNTEEYSQVVMWLQGLTGLIERVQVYEDAESRMVLQEWIKERNQLRELTKTIFNPQFGSIFRTHHNPTYFSRRLSRFADIYMASLSCILNYNLHNTFYPRRTPLQHEAALWADHPCRGVEGVAQIK